LRFSVSANTKKNSAHGERDQRSGAIQQARFRSDVHFLKRSTTPSTQASNPTVDPRGPAGEESRKTTVPYSDVLHCLWLCFVEAFALRWDLPAAESLMLHQSLCHRTLHLKVSLLKKRSRGPCRVRSKSAGMTRALRRSRLCERWSKEGRRCSRVRDRRTR